MGGVFETKAVWASVVAVTAIIVFANSAEAQKPTKDYEAHCRAAHQEESGLGRCRKLGERCQKGDEQSNRICGEELDRAKEDVERFAANSTTTMDTSQLRQGWQEDLQTQCYQAAERVRAASEECLDRLNESQMSHCGGYASSYGKGRGTPLSTLDQRFRQKAVESTKDLDQLCPQLDSVMQSIGADVGAGLQKDTGPLGWGD